MMHFLVEKCSSLQYDSPSTFGSNFGVEMNKTWADGKPLRGTDGKAPKIKVPVANAESRLGPRITGQYYSRIIQHRRRCFLLCGNALDLWLSDGQGQA